ncbi:hypothetical protein [Wolbachia endosymbiont (group E) of Neria commutata]|uniref:hypothetical protein n=1 Tax=Wolbachia endosymbiont (group E) of Neria commutata TaxID=3066149 RepID=UPI00313305AC
MVKNGTGNDDNISQTSTSSTSSSQSRKELASDWKQGKHIVEAKNRITVLQNSGFSVLETVAHELSKILNKKDKNSEKLADIINKSDREDFQKGCLRLYEDIEDDIQLLVNANDSKQVELETKILEKLPERIEEAKYERSLSPEKISNIIKGLEEVPTLGRKSEYLKAEFDKLGVAGKSLAVATVATVGTLGALASPFVVGAGLVAAPFVGAGYAAKKGGEALDKPALEGRQELAEEKKKAVHDDKLAPKVNELAKEFIDFAVLKGQVGILRAAIKQSPELGNIISEANLNIIEEFITARTGKLERLGMYNQVLNELGEEAARKILTLMENIKDPKELSPEESAYFRSLKKVVTNGFSASIKSAFSNKIITTGSEANRALLSNIKKDNFVNARDVLKNCSKLNEENRKKLDVDLKSKLGSNAHLVNILDKRNPSGDELNLLAGAFNLLNKEDMKELAEKSAKLLTQQKQEEKGILDKVKSVLDGVLDKMKDVSGKVKSLFTRGTSAEEVSEKNKNLNI